MGGGQQNGTYPLYNHDPKGHEIRHLFTDRLNNFDDAGQYAAFNLRAMLDFARSDTSVSLKVWSAPGRSRPLFKEAVKNSFTTTAKGASFGPSWTTHWFLVEMQVPREWEYEKIQFEFNCDCEAMVHNTDGEPLQGLTGGNGGDQRHEYIIPKAWHTGTHQFYVEASMNGMFGNGEPPNENKSFYLSKADLVAPNTEAVALFNDFWIIKDCAKELEQNSWESHFGLQVANEIMNTFELGNHGSIKECRKIAENFLGKNINSHKVYESKENAFITAVGHCHIDTAWLWPFDETKRKAARSWSTQLDLMERYPEHTFTCSQAQQYHWLKQDYPSLFSRVSKAVKQGKFEPIGGSWVEMDANMPSGEALARQFLYGQRFFEHHFGLRSKVFWLPDTFGYCAQLPQLCRLSGMDYGFTQKLSWNNINEFPNTTFNWVSLDGSQMLMHLAPSNTYGAQCDVGDAVRSMSQHKSLSESRYSLLLFGNGDGGGGPLATMLEKLRRLRGVSDTVGNLPRVTIGESVTEFYNRVEKETDGGRKLATWSGELYLEFHRGTYTSQSKTKRNNRKCEVLLHDIEYLATVASIYTDYKYPKKEIDEMWQLVLLCQFHDVLPGSAIEMVYEDASKLYKNVYKVGEKVLANALEKLGLKESAEPEATSALNCLPWNRTGIVESKLLSGSNLAPFVEPKSPVSIHEENSIYTLENSRLKVVIEEGVIISLYDTHAKREIIRDGRKGGQFIILDDDKPLSFQAWDTELYSLNTRRELKPTKVTKAYHEMKNIVGVEVKYTISSKSKFTAFISLEAESDMVKFSCTANWYEDHKFLKVEFPVDVQSARASYESQFGIIERPTHFNTSWDYAKFEVCSHKWADLSENTYGVSILNDCKYGFATHGNVMRLSLLRSPKSPDAHADMGRQQFNFAIMPHKGSLESKTIRAAKEFNSPMRLVKGTSPHLDSIKIEGHPSIILETIKRGEDDEDVSYEGSEVQKGRSVILRLYDALGGQADATITTAFKVKAAYKTNILEDELHELPVHNKSSIMVHLRAFEVFTLKLQLV